MSAVKSVRVEVLAPFKVALDGQVWRPGEVVEIDEVIAGRWLRYGYVRLIEAEHRIRPKHPDEPLSEN